MDDRATQLPARALVEAAVGSLERGCELVGCPGTEVSDLVPVHAACGTGFAAGVGLAGGHAAGLSRRLSTVASALTTLAGARGLGETWLRPQREVGPRPAGAEGPPSRRGGDRTNGEQGQVRGVRRPLVGAVADLAWLEATAGGPGGGRAPAATSWSSAWSAGVVPFEFARSLSKASGGWTSIRGRAAVGVSLGGIGGLWCGGCGGHQVSLPSVPVAPRPEERPAAFASSRARRHSTLPGGQARAARKERDSALPRWGSSSRRGLWEPRRQRGHHGGTWSVLVTCRSFAGRDPRYAHTPALAGPRVSATASGLVRSGAPRTVGAAGRSSCCGGCSPRTGRRPAREGCCG